MMCILSLDRPVLRKWFHVWIIFTFFAGLLVIVCDIIPLLRWYILLFIFHFHQCIFISNMAINSMGVIRIAHAMWMKGNAFIYCLFTRWKKNETLLLMFLNMLQMWEFGFLFLNVDELVIYSTVFLFHMKLFFSNNSFYWLFHFSTWRKILLNINKIIIKNQSFVRYLFYCIFC